MALEFVKVSNNLDLDIILDMNLVTHLDYLGVSAVYNYIVNSYSSDGGCTHATLEQTTGELTWTDGVCTSVDDVARVRINSEDYILCNISVDTHGRAIVSVVKPKDISRSDSFLLEEMDDLEVENFVVYFR